jgi:hypothetical protein
MTNNTDAVNTRGLSYSVFKTYILSTGRHAIHASEPVASILREKTEGEGKGKKGRESGEGSRVG